MSSAVVGAAIVVAVNGVVVVAVLVAVDVCCSC